MWVKEFSERMGVFVNGFQAYLPNTYEQNIAIFEEILWLERVKAGVCL